MRRIAAQIPIALYCSRCGIPMRPRFALLALLAACAEEPGSLESKPLRIVSLSPALTEMVRAGGGGDRLVGRTAWCVVEGGVPVVGSLHDFDPELLLATRPTHVLAQREAAADDGTLERCCARHGIELRRWHIDSIEEIECAVRDVGSLLGPAGEQWSEDWNRSLPAAGAQSQQGPVLILAPGDPYFAFGEGTYLLGVARRLGWTVAAPGPGYPTLSLEDLASLDPPRILLVTDDPSEMERLRERLADILPGRTPLLASIPSRALIPGASLPETAAAMRGAWESRP